MHIEGLSEAAEQRLTVLMSPRNEGDESRSMPTLRFTLAIARAIADLPEEEHVPSLAHVLSIGYRYGQLSPVHTLYGEYPTDAEIPADAVKAWERHQQARDLELKALVASVKAQRPTLLEVARRAWSWASSFDNQTALAYAIRMLLESELANYAQLPSIEVPEPERDDEAYRALLFKHRDVRSALLATDRAEHLTTKSERGATILAILNSVEDLDTRAKVVGFVKTVFVDTIGPMRRRRRGPRSSRVFE